MFLSIPAMSRSGCLFFCKLIDYMHANPLRRGLAAKAEDWEWSSAR